MNKYLAFITNLQIFWTLVRISIWRIRILKLFKYLVDIGIIRGLLYCHGPILWTTGWLRAIRTWARERQIIVIFILAILTRFLIFIFAIIYSFTLTISADYFLISIGKSWDFIFDFLSCHFIVLVIISIVIILLGTTTGAANYFWTRRCLRLLNFLQWIFSWSSAFVFKWHSIFVKFLDLSWRLIIRIWRSTDSFLGLNLNHLSNLWILKIIVEWLYSDSST